VFAEPARDVLKLQHECPDVPHSGHSPRSMTVGCQSGEHPV
jgi:hypothetical protein